MTLEELKAEADKRGYRLVKKLILLPCPICGKEPTLWLNANGLKSYACVTCDDTGWAARTEKEAIELWNDYAERKKNEQTKR